jgi:predicted ArsR family transcriptional regulator
MGTEIGRDAGRRREVLRVLRASDEPLSIVAVADVLGVHPNTVRFHLDGLLGDGQVEQVAPGRTRPGRPAQMFRAVRQMDRGGARHYQLLAEILLAAIGDESDSSAKALAAGRAWGRRLDPPQGDAVEHLVDVLDGLGFAPERGVQQIGLRHCPFLELAEHRTAVVCPIHLGLMQGALQSWGAPATVARLDAFAEPDLCVAHLEGTAR